jgi:hypothetical protein
MDLVPDTHAHCDASVHGDGKTASLGAGRGAGRLGFAGTAHPADASLPAGWTTLARDGFGGGPRVPMLPADWDHDADAR